MTTNQTPRKEKEYGTWPLFIFAFGLIGLMLILYWIKIHFFG